MISDSPKDSAKDASRVLSVTAPPWFPISTRKKKTKEERAGPRKRRPRNKGGVAQQNLNVAEAERRSWTAWVILEAEAERRRRMMVDEELDRINELERKERQDMAVRMVQREMRDLEGKGMLAALQSTVFFAETIQSTYTEDYELCCPYYSMGCRIICQRSNLEQHLCECSFALSGEEHVKTEESRVASEQGSARTTPSYEITCAFSFCGCTWAGPLGNLPSHLRECSFTGATGAEREGEGADERRKQLEDVIAQEEIERERRLQGGHMDNDKCFVVQAIQLQQREIKTHIRARSGVFRRKLTEELSAHRQGVQERCNALAPLRALCLEHVRTSIQSLWPDVHVHAYGSFETGLGLPDSDVDVVLMFPSQGTTVSMMDTHQSRVVAEERLMELMTHLQTIGSTTDGKLDALKFVPASSVGLIKGTFTADMSSDAGQSVEYHSIALDISIDSPTHSGLAAITFVDTCLTHLPCLVPVVVALKSWLRPAMLTDSYQGGLPPYALFLLSLASALRLCEAMRVMDRNGFTGDTSGRVGCGASNDASQATSLSSSLVDNVVTATKAARGRACAQEIITRADEHTSSQLQSSDVLLDVLGLLEDMLLNRLGVDSTMRFTSIAREHANSTDPLVVIDPLFGENVAKSCFKLDTIAMLFESALERSRLTTMKSTHNEDGLLWDILQHLDA